MVTGVGIVGRERELSVLVDCLDAARRGHPRVVSCRGEPGIGKTRLAEELGRSAAASGVLVAWGLGMEMAGTPPYWPWRQVLRALSVQTHLVAIADEHRFFWHCGRLCRVWDYCPGSRAEVPGGDRSRTCWPGAGVVRSCRLS